MAPPDTGLAARYLPRFRRDPFSASVLPRHRRPLGPDLGTFWRHRVELDSTRNVFRVREQVGGRDVRYPVELDYETYRRERLRQDLRDNFRDLADQRMQQRRQQRRGGLGVNIVVPGGRNSAFTTIFGKPEVDLRVTGQADIRAGFDYRKSDQQVAFTGRASQVDPDFKQDLRLGITGTIGDKLRVDVNWDTNNQFDYQNQLKLEYTGYEDEIIQKIEAGNVFLNTPSSLIRGGQSLFGIKSELQIGGLRLTTVASQQEGQSNSLSIEGGSTSTEFDLKPTDYDDNTHFFLGYYFRNRWEPALADPPNIIVANGFERITDIEVWRLMPTSSGEENVRQVLALVDLGEPAEIVTLADGYTRADVSALPDNAVDQYDDAEAERLRDAATNVQNVLVSPAEMDQPLGDLDYQVGRFKKLERGRDYEIDEVLGYISLRQRLPESEALAVSFRYLANGRTYQVGDFAAETGGSLGGQIEDRLLLKLLRPVNMKQPVLTGGEDSFNPAAWYLQLRNIYRFPGRGLNANEFELDVVYEAPGKAPTERLPGVGGQQTLLQLLGLDRLNEQGAPRPDNLFDYAPGFTIDPGNGLLIFPTLEPFAGNLARQIEASVSDPARQQELKALYVFDELYTQKKENARRNTQLDVYRVRGSYKGSVQSFYDLRAFAGVIEGSVRVTSGGTPLQEGVDYTVDYQGGSVTITNPAYLTPGRDIEIEYEQNSFLNLQKKTLLGLRADYDISNNLALGATLMRLSQKSPIDKFRIGEEPISNTIWGVDGSLELEPRWLTRAIDALPLLQTRAPSSISLTGEFAQLRPGHTQTTAFRRTQNTLQDQGLDFKHDELGGISYIDDFEGFENTFSLRQAGAWQLSAAPDSIPRYPCPGNLRCATEDSLRTTWRATFAWYQLNNNLLEELSRKAPITPAVAPVLIKDVFPNKDTRGEIDQTLPTMDVYFNPHERGPYNYTTELKDFLDNPRETWGGMTQRLPEGYTDFETRNIEFVEFVFRPYSEAPGGDAGRSARLYMDLGSISEDVLPNGKLNNEDGLSTTTVGSGSLDAWSRLPTSTTNGVINIDQATRRTEDLGLDGLASYDPSAYDPPATEAFVFRSFLNALDPSDPDPRYRVEVAKALRDPSGDDYYYFDDDAYFGDPTLYPEGATIQQRFSRYGPGLELNAYESQSQFGQGQVKRGNARYPDSEDLNLNSSIDTDNSYYQYMLPLSLAVLDSLARPDRQDDYVVGEITDKDGRGTGWYQVRIPVRNFTRRVGSIQDFSLIESIRLWTTGHIAPITMRFAEFELVGSQWRKEDKVAQEREAVVDTSTTRLSIASINNEENGDVYKTPNGTIISQIRLATGVQQQAREQALVLRVEDLPPGKQRAISKTFQGLDLLKYSNLRMFVHMHGRLGSGIDLADLQAVTGEDPRSKVRLFVRLGANETNDYYEYEQPLSPSRLAEGLSPDEIWQTNQNYNGQILDLNSMNIRLSALNQLKVARDERAAPLDSVFWHDENGVPLNPSVEDFAPPGTRLGIKGSPNLGRINTIIIGIRNPADTTGMASVDPNNVLDDVTIWINELRVAGYDEGNGWAALANAEVQLADLGRVRANVQTQTDGFGSLSSSLGERDQTSILNWGVNTDVNLDKFIPERFGWAVPVSVQVQSNTTTPRFSPNRGDVRLEEIVNQIESDTSYTPAQRDSLKRQAIESAQTHTFSRSFTTSIRKQNSRSPLLRYTLDGLSVSYAYSVSEGRSPSQRLNDQWRWTSTLNYRLAVRRPRTIRPFGWLGEVPVLGWLGGLQFNYLPQSFNASATAARNFAQSRDRNNAVRREEGAEVLPETIAFPFREQHSFSHRRNVSLQYNPFNFLNLSLDTRTSQSLSAIGADTTFTTFVRRTDDPTRFDLLPGSFNDNGIPDSLRGVDAFQQERLEVRSTGAVLDDLLKGTASLRTEDHGQSFTGTFRPQLNRIQALNWINVQDVVYGVQYGWRNGPVGRNTGASVNNAVNIRGGLTLRPQELFRKFDFYQSLERKQREAEQEKRAERQRRQREREERRRQREEERRQREEEERRRREAEANTPADTPTDTPADTPTDTPADTPAGGPPEAGAAEAEDGPGFRLPLPDPAALARRFVLAVTGMRDFSVTYTGTRSANSSNVGTPVRDRNNRLVDVETHYSLIDALFNDVGVPLRYRFGFDRTIDPASGYRVVDSLLQVTDVLQNSNKVQGRTTLSPSSTFQISLNWNVDWSQGQNITYRPGPDGVLANTTENGRNSASVWAFGASYRGLFERQLDRYARDVQGLAPGADLRDRNGDGVVLTNASVVDDFTGAFVSSFGRLDGRGLLPFPMPGWTVSYSGIANWPLLHRITQNVTLRHTYSADYSTDFRTNVLAASQDSASFDLGGRRVVYALADEEVGSVRVNERFSPLVGVDISWKGRIQTNLSWNKSNTYSLSTSTFEVGETRTNELTFSANYSRQGLRLPFLRRSLNNRITFSLTASLSETNDQRYLMRRALIDASADPRAYDPDLALAGDNISLVTAFTRLSMAPQVSYQFSNKVSASFQMRYEKFDSQDSLQPSYTNVSGGFNVRVSISN
ncbi:cell surface protein SprA [Rhodothermaceae bacterium RA]|nr:cell surface protein SprA [Rhodothermaceae bacterium RA]